MKWRGFWLGFSLLFLGGCAGPFATGQRSATADSTAGPDQRAIELFTEGTTYEIAGNVQAALLSYQEALIYDSTSADIFLAAGKAYLRLGKEESAMHTLRRCVALDPDQVEAHDLLARIYARQGWWPLVEKTYRQILAVDSTNADAYVQLAIFYLRQRRQEEASAMYRKVLQLQAVPDPQILVTLGELYMDMDDYRRAETLYVRMIELHPEEAYGFYGLGMSREAMQDTAGAVGAYTHSLELDPALSPARERLGRIYQEREEWPVAYELFKEGIAVDSTDLSNWIELGSLYRRMEDSTSAAGIYETILQRFPGDWQAHMDAGRFRLDHGEFHRALESFRRVVELDSRNAWGWLFQGIAYVMLDSTEAAVHSLREALESLPHDPLGNYYLGSILMQREEYRAARPYLRTALEVRPEWVSALNALATAEDALGNHEISDSLYTRALEVEPDNALILNNFAYSLSLRGLRLDEALNMARHALEKEPENGAYLDTVGYIHFMMGDPRTARDFMEKAMEIRPDNAEVIVHLGDVMSALGDREKAVALWKRALQLDSDNEEARQRLAEAGESLDE